MEDNLNEIAESLVYVKGTKRRIVKRKVENRQCPSLCREKALISPLGTLKPLNHSPEELLEVLFLDREP